MQKTKDTPLDKKKKKKKKGCIENTRKNQKSIEEDTKGEHIQEQRKLHIDLRPVPQRKPLVLQTLHYHGKTEVHTRIAAVIVVAVTVVIVVGVVLGVEVAVVEVLEVVE